MILGHLYQWGRHNYPAQHASLVFSSSTALSTIMLFWRQTALLTNINRACLHRQCAGEEICPKLSIQSCYRSFKLKICVLLPVEKCVRERKQESPYCVVSLGHKWWMGDTVNGQVQREKKITQIWWGYKSTTVIGIHNLKCRLVEDKSVSVQLLGRWWSHSDALHWSKSYSEGTWN